MLPEVRSSSEIYGEAALDEIKGVPIAGILGDQQAALVGPGVFRARRSEKYVRHRMFSADEYRRAPGSQQMRAADDRGLQIWKQHRRTTRWKAAWPLPERWCSGCATISD